MAVKIIANYSKRLGLPGYSSHQFSVSVETELSNTENVSLEAARLYKTLQSAVDKEMQSTGFVPNPEYGSAPPQQVEKDSRATNTPVLNGFQNKQWKASDKQRELVLKLIENTGINIETVEEISEEMFNTGNLPELNKIQMSGLIEELLSRFSKKPRRESPQGMAQRYNARSSR